jgi:hypothetical protein
MIIGRKIKCEESRNGNMKGIRPIAWVYKGFMNIDNFSTAEATSLSLASMSAPASIKSFDMSVKPYTDAEKRAVQPS